eukprot:PhF_6_TR31497/c2_g1_i2/m.46352
MTTLSKCFLWHKQCMCIPMPMRTGVWKYRMPCINNTVQQHSSSAFFVVAVLPLSLVGYGQHNKLGVLLKFFTAGSRGDAWWWDVWASAPYKAILLVCVSVFVEKETTQLLMYCCVSWSQVYLLAMTSPRETALFNYIEAYGYFVCSFVALMLVMQARTMFTTQVDVVIQVVLGITLGLHILLGCGIGLMVTAFPEFVNLTMPKNKGRDDEVVANNDDNDDTTTEDDTNDGNDDDKTKIEDTAAAPQKANSHSSTTFVHYSISPQM